MAAALRMSVQPISSPAQEKGFLDGAGMFHCGYTEPPGDGWSVVEIDFPVHTLIAGRGHEVSVSLQRPFKPAGLM